MHLAQYMEGKSKDEPVGLIEETFLGWDPQYVVLNLGVLYHGGPCKLSLQIFLLTPVPDQRPVAEFIA